MLDIIRQKASHLWTAFYKSVYFLWLCVGIYALVNWIIWQGLQQANNIIVCMSILWLIFVSLGWSGYRGNYDVIGIDIKWFSISVLSFVGLVVLVDDIRILIFPIAASIPLSTSIINEFEFDWYDNWYYETYLGNLDYEYDRIKGIWILEKKSRDDEKYDFIGSFVLFLGAIYFFFFLMACFSSTDEGFKKMVALGTITNATFSMLIVWMIYNNEKEVRPMRKAMGGKVSHDAISKLKRMYPRGLEVDRIQFLLHDTLKQKGAARIIKTSYDSPPTLYENRKDERKYTKTIMTLFRVFPSIVSTMYTADDEGDIPFRLACQYASVEVVKHMVGLDNELLNIRDSKGNTVMHYACQGNNYKVVNYLLNRHMILAVTRNFDGDLPVYILCSSELVHKHRLFVENAPRPQHLDTVMRLMLAYPEDIQREKLQPASPPPKEKEPASSPTLTEQAVDSEEGDQSAPSPKPQKPLKSLIHIILVIVNMTAAVYIGTLQSFSNTNQMKHESEVKRLVDELIASQNEMNLLRSRMEVLKHASEGHSHSMLKVM